MWSTTFITIIPITYSDYVKLAIEISWNFTLFILGQSQKLKKGYIKIMIYEN